MCFLIDIGIAAIIKAYKNENRKNQINMFLFFAGHSQLDSLLNIWLGTQKFEGSSVLVNTKRGVK